MRQLIFKRKNQLEWIETEEPKITTSNQAIVKPLCISRCDLDLAIITGNTLFRPPFPIGHEFIGEIVECSEELKSRFLPKQKVIIPFQISCGTCPSCHEGHSKDCESMSSHPSDFGMGSSAKKHGGAISELVLVPYAAHMMIPISDKVNPISIASISDNIVEAWKMIGIHVKDLPEQNILVQGGYASSIGLYCAVLAKSLGHKVTYSDFSKERLDLAEKNGISILEIESYSKSLGKFDLVADSSGTKEGLVSAIRSIRSYGRVTSSSIFWTNSLEIPFLEMYDKGVNLSIGRVNSYEWIPEILQRIESGSYNVDSIVTKIASFSDAKDAMFENTTKLVIDNRN